MPTPDRAENLQKNVRKYIFEHFQEHTIVTTLPSGRLVVQRDSSRLGTTQYLAKPRVTPCYFSSSLCEGN